MQELEALVTQHRLGELIATVTALADKPRRALHAWIKEWWAQHGSAIYHQGSPGQYFEARTCALIVSVLSAKDAAQGLAISVEAAVGLKRLDPVTLENQAALAQAVIWRGPEFAAAFVQRCAVGNRRRAMFTQVLTAAIEAFDLPPPDDGEFCEMLAQELMPVIRGRYCPSAQDFVRTPEPTLHVVRGSALPGAGGLELSVVKPRDMTEALALTFRLQWLLLTLCARKDGCLLLLRNGDSYPVAAKNVATQLQAAVQAGHLQAEPLADALLGALLRGDSSTAQRLQARLLQDLQPALPDTAGWQQRNADALLHLLTAKESAPAALALELLEALEAHHPLPPEAFVRACEMVFARKEKGLRDTTLAWGLRRAKDRPAVATESLQGLLQALLVEDYAFKKSALVRLQALWQGLQPCAQVLVQAPLASALAGLEPDLAATASAWTGLTEGPRTTGPSDTAPTTEPANPGTPAAAALQRPQAPPRPFVPIEASVTALVEHAALMQARPSVAAQEQLIDANLRLSAIQRSQGMPLGTALPEAPLAQSHQLARLLRLARRGELTQEHLHHSADRASVLDRHCAVPAPFADPATRSQADLYSHAARTGDPFHAICILRNGEIVQAIANGTPYPLLSRPSWEHGGIAPADLVERLAQLASAGAEAPPVDLLVALMRTARAGAATVAALQALGSGAALTAAGFFKAGGMDQMASLLTPVQRSSTYGNQVWLADWDHALPTELAVTLPRMATLPAIAGVPHSWSWGFTPATAPDLWGVTDDTAGLLAESGDMLAALHLWGFRKAAGEVSDTSFGKDVAQRLPVVLQARGPMGPASHLALLYSLSATDAAVRIVAVDALLDLLQEGRFRSADSAPLLARALDCGSIKVTRLAATLAQVAGALAGEPVGDDAREHCWALVRTALASALAQPTPPPGGPELAALASQMLPLVADQAPIAGVAEQAARKGSGKLVLECRRLHALMSTA